MTQPLVSVCIPAFNQSHYLKLAVESALVQTISNIEIVIVDDGSSDETRAVCESFHDPRVRYVYQENDGSRGLGARNRAMLLARGEWIALLDQDDLWKPEKLEKQLAMATNRSEIGLIFSRVEFIDGDGNVTGKQTDELPEGDVLARVLESNCYFACTGMFRTELLKLAGLPGEPNGISDWLLWATIARQTHCAVHQDTLAQYRIHASGYQVSLRAANRYKNCIDHIKTFRAMIPVVRTDDPNCVKAFKRQRRNLAHELIRTSRHYLKSGEFKKESLLAARDAFEIDPCWLLTPWVLLQQTLSMAAAAIQGSFSRK